MIRQLSLTILVAGFVVTAHAGVLPTIDVGKSADVNGRIVEMPAVNFGTVPQSVIGQQPISPLSGKTRVPGQVVETRNVELTTLEFSNVPTKTVPLTNFTPKHGVITTAIVPHDKVETRTADINKRVIPAQTPAGAEELKKQFTQPQ